MKTNVTAIAFVLAMLPMLAFSEAENYASTTDVRLTNQSFYGIVLNGNANVYLSQGTTSSVRVEGNKQNVKDVETSINDGILTVKTGSLRNVSVYVTMPEISLIQVNGNGVINARQPINSDILLMKITGNGIISADVRTLSLGMVINGDGRIYLRGISGESFLKVKGNGKVVAMNFDSLRMATSPGSFTSVKQAEDNVQPRRVLNLHQ